MGSRDLPGSKRISNAGWILAIALVAAGGAGALWWLKSGRFQDAAEVSIEEYLTVLRANSIQEVWISDHELRAEVTQGFPRSGRRYRYVHLILPPGFLVDSQRFMLLTKGLDPRMAHYEK